MLFSPLLNLKLNYRNHRKIVVIDGKIGYMGGVNLRADHMGKNKRLSPWRDTQIKIEGSAVLALQNIFFNDWLYAKNEKLTQNQIKEYFIKPNKTSGCNMQIVSSGPEEKQNKTKMLYLNTINNSHKFLYIQTTYFIVKQDVLNQIIDAKNRGVNITIIVPKKPDNKVVYAGTLKCLEYLIKNNINVYLYNGFIHSKVVLSENVLCVGSANFDNRSMDLNFEATACIYGKRYINNYKQIINEDLTNSKVLTIKKLKSLKSYSIIFNVLYKIFYRLL